MDKDEIIKELAEKNAKLEEELQVTKEHLKKYTAPVSRKMYYEKNKEVIKECGWFTGYYAVRAVVDCGIETAMVHQISIR